MVYAVLAWTHDVEDSQENKEDPGGEDDASMKPVVSHSLTCTFSAEVQKG